MHDAKAHVKSYVSIFVILLVLTGVTVGAAFIDLGFLNTFAALGIAFLKAILVALFFMHLLESKPLTKLFALAALAWLSIMFVLTLTDYLSRHWPL